MKLNISIKKRK